MSEIDIHEKRFALDVLAKAAGCSPRTLTTWRNRNGLLAESVTGTKKHKFFSIVDACVLRAVVVLTTHGLDTPDAIWFADGHLRSIFGILLSGEKFSSLVGFCKPGRKKGERASFFVFRRNDNFGELIAKTNGVVTVIDLETIIKHVLAALKIEGE